MKSYKMRLSTNRIVENIPGEILYKIREVYKKKQVELPCAPY